MARPLASTMRLLLSSVPVGVSGGFRVFIAFLLAGITPIARSCVASALVIYAVYLLDRTIPCSEDRINQEECWNADRKAGTLISCLAYIFGALIFFNDGLYLVPLIPLIIGVMYSRGISFAGYHIKLKGGAGLKNLVIGLVWGGSIALVIARWSADIIAVTCIFIFFSVKLFVNSTIFDFKDMAGDLVAGICTIPAILGVEQTKRLLVSISSGLHLVMLYAVITGFIRPESIILCYSALVGVFFVWFYRVEWEFQQIGIKKYLRQLLIDGESALSLLLRFFTGVLQVAIAPGSI